jgi:hypothetical protein
MATISSLTLWALGWSHIRFVSRGGRLRRATRGVGNLARKNRSGQNVPGSVSISPRTNAQRGAGADFRLCETRHATARY